MANADVCEARIATHAHFQLHEASRVAAGDNLGAGGGDVIELSGQQLCRLLGLREAVYARAAAAPIGLRQLD
jgi:hypothetical protein